MFLKTSLLTKQASQNSNIPKTMKWLLTLVTIFIFLLTALAAFAIIYNKLYEYRFFPGVKIINQSLKNLNSYQAIGKFQKEIDDFLQTGITYKFYDEEINIPLILPATADPDFSIQLVNFKINEVVEKAYQVGRNKEYYQNFLEQMKALLLGINLPLEYEFYQEEFLDILKNGLEKYVTPKIEARPKFDEEFNLEIISESAGTNFDYQLILEQAINQFSNLSQQPIVINLIIDESIIKEEEISKQLIKDINDFVATSSITLFYQDSDWEVTNQIFKDWLIFKEFEGEVVLGLDASTTTAYLEKEVALDIYQPILDAKFDIKNGRVAEFQGSQDGRELDIEKSVIKMERELWENNNFEIELVVNETKAKVTTANVNDLGISEIIGIGQSNFSGSPQNRRHNIAVGAGTLNGILIKPDEEFSLIKALGKVDAATGYKPELVIKGDETIPEYGGGLCQIGTTMFRSALASGLPITERRPHSYRVVYYEPAGKDATIYDPRPDFKFINDTGNHILIQSRIEGNNLYFDFWGTSDGRVVEQSDSVIYNVTSPGPTQYIETDELEPGEEDCIERAHNGADAYFDYKVTYPDGGVEEMRFTSHYISWPAKCLVGKEPETATSTEEILEE